jgi:hypothetical protein
MPSSLNFTVGSLLIQQVELIGPEAVSLDSLWRAAGSPPEQSPRKWTELAAPLIAGFVRYFATLPGRTTEIDERRPLLWVWVGEEGEPWRTGDLMAHELLARVYAAFLDS